MSIKIGIIGANGYTGFELLRLLTNHAEAKVVFAASRSKAGTELAALYPAFKGFYKDMQFCDPNDYIKYKTDVIFSCLPHGASAGIIAEIMKKTTAKVIDLSADFRYNSLELFEKTYKITHPAPEIYSEAVYGLTELNRNEIKSCRLLANPGCYTTASIMPLYPLIKEKLIENRGIIIDAKSGTSGAGRKADEAYGFCEVNENFKAYGITTHRHTSEIEEKLSIYENVALSFTPHLLPVKRGILNTIYADIKNGTTTEKIKTAYKKYYGNEKFVIVDDEGTYPELKDVVGSNQIRIGYKIDTRLNRIIIISVIDNLIKGASGQALQNMNVMTGLDEGMGLSLVGRHL